MKGVSLFDKPSTMPTQVSAGYPYALQVSHGQSDEPVEMRHRIAEDFDQLLDLQPDWDCLVLRTAGDIYSTFDWCRIWWRHYGFGRELQVHIFRNGPELVGVAPLFIESVCLGPLHLRLARVVGCDHSVTNCGLAILPEFVPKVMAAIADSVASCECDGLQIGPLSGYDTGLGAMETSLCATPFSNVSIGVSHPHMLFDVPETFDAYLAGLSTKERRNVRRDERKLDEHGKTAACVVQDVQRLPICFSNFIDMHQRQWRVQGQLGHFDDWPCARAFHREMAVRQIELNRLLLTELRVAHDTVAMEYSYQFGSRVHWILGARAPGITGRIGFSMLMREAILRKVTVIDALRGLYDYKRQLGASLAFQQTLLAMRAGLVRRFRLRGFKAAGRLLNLLYYRLWFSRIRPKIGVGDRPLLTLWIRSRI